MNIVIGYDGSDCAKAAVDDLQRYGLPCRANAVIVSKAGALSYEGSQRIQALFPGWVTVPEPIVGDPADAIMRKADGWETDLVVVGSHGRSARGRFVQGSVSMRVATESRCSVLVARKVVERPNAIIRIIVGVNGSRDAEAAVHAVASRTWPAGSEARVISVGSITERNADPIAMACAMVEQAADELLATGLHVSVRVTKGSPQHVLSDAAGKWAADCIFIGARPFKRAYDRFRAGSIATVLVTHSPCSVEVVRVREYGSE